MTQPELGDSEKQAGAVQLRLELECPLQADDGFFVPALFFANQGEVEMSFGEAGLLFGDRRKASSCLFQLALLHGLGRLREFSGGVRTLRCEQKCRTQEDPKQASTRA